MSGLQFCGETKQGVVGTWGVGAEMAATVRRQHLQFWKFIQRTFEDQALQGDCRIERIADRIGQPAVSA